MSDNDTAEEPQDSEDSTVGTCQVEGCHRKATEIVIWGEWADDLKEHREKQCTPCASQLQRGFGAVNIQRTEVC